MEIHFDRLELEKGAGHLRGHAERNAFVGLDADDQDVGILQLALAIEEDGRRAAELDGDLGAGLGQPFAHAHEKRNAGPTPVVDVEAEGDISFGHGLRRNARLVAVGGHFLPVDEASGVLGADHIFRDGLAGQRAQGLHDFDLLVAHGVGAEIDGWFHRGEAKKLQEVVLHHVAQGAGIFVISRA